ELAHTIQQHSRPAAGPIQPKSRLIPPQHPLEREAEQAARQVTAPPSPHKPAVPSLTRLPAGGLPLVLRRLEATQEAVQTVDGAGPVPPLDSVITQVQTILEQDPRDLSGQARRLLWRFDPLTRQLILAHARARLAQAAPPPSVAATEE